MGRAPIVVHRPSVSGGRRVTVSRHGHDEILGIAYCDRDLVALLEAAGVYEAERVLDDPMWVEWRGGGAHQWDAA
ncbi:hypothetical protein [Streptomyces subrutilus]|uniref:hypothetical protein n=1 Tax=Streptomyces subrutilus TaxID=36818 RepID=UPI0033D081CF